MSKKVLLSNLLLFSLVNVYGQILNETQKDILNTQKNIAKESEIIDKYNWISNINLGLSSTKNDSNNQTKSFNISLNQNIFKFGGIFYTIDLAKVQKKYNLLNTNIVNDGYLNTIYTTVINLKKNNCKIKQIKLKIENKIIAINIKKDEYKSGQIGISDLNDAIMGKNVLQENLIELEKIKTNYVSSLKEYSNIDYKKIEIPKFNLITKSDYLKKSKDIKLAKLNTKVKDLDYKIKKTDYLPTISITSNYKYDYENDEDDYEYGLKISIPFDFLSIHKTQKTRLEYLLAKNKQRQTLLKKEAKYQRFISNIKAYRKNRQIALEDINLYNQLLKTTKLEYKDGYKNIEDVKILKNTRKIRKLDYKIYGLSIQNEFISLYFD